MKAVLLFVALCFVWPAEAARRPNIILMMADDCGYEALACNGGTTYQTPTGDMPRSCG